VRRSGDLPADEVTTTDGIPVTTVPRTLLDLAAIVPAHHLRRALERAEQLELLDARAIRAVLAAHPRRPGSPALTALLVDVAQHDITLTRSDVEAALLQLCLDHGLPRPRVNRHQDGVEVDFRWPEQRLLVEVDGWTSHGTRARFASDRARDRAALRAGWRTARFTATEVQRRPTAVATELSTLLGNGRLRSGIA
jgi:very-short-patch-repair endonuclease